MISKGDWQARVFYLEKQHAAAAEIYKGVRVAHGAVGKLFGAQRGLNLTGCNEMDLREVLTAWDVLQGKQEELIESWRGDSMEGREAIQEHLRELAVPKAEMELQRARNLMYLNEIYLSDRTIASLDAFVGVCNQWILRRQFPPERGDKVEPVSRAELNSALDDVQVALRDELMNGPLRLSEPAASARPGREQSNRGDLNGSDGS